MKLLPLLLLVLLIASCSSGVVATGPNSYMISKSVHGFSSGAAGKADVYREASSWCAKKGLVMIPISSDSHDPVAGRGMGSAEIHFRAVPPSEANRYQSTTESRPNVVIETRER